MPRTKTPKKRQSSRARPPAQGTHARLDVDARRAQLLALGVEHFSRDAYDDVSIDVIAQAAGISKGLLYHYFPTKRAFYAATVSAAAADLLRVTLGAADVATDPLSRLTSAVDAYLAFVDDHARAFVALMRSGIGVGSEIAEVIDGTRDTLLENLLGRLEMGAGSPSPLLLIALRGWIGFAENASLAWLRARDERSDRADRRSENRRVPTREEVRDLVVKTLVNLLSDLGTLPRT